MIASAVESGVFEEISQHCDGITSENLADILKLNPDALLRVLNACVSMELLDTSQDSKGNGTCTFTTLIAPNFTHNKLMNK